MHKILHVPTTVETSPLSTKSEILLLSKWLELKFALCPCISEHAENVYLKKFLLKGSHHPLHRCQPDFWDATDHAKDFCLGDFASSLSAI